MDKTGYYYNFYPFFYLPLFVSLQLLYKPATPRTGCLRKLLLDTQGAWHV